MKLEAYLSSLSNIKNKTQLKRNVRLMKSIITELAKKPISTNYIYEFFNVDKKILDYTISNLLKNDIITTIGGKYKITSNGNKLVIEYGLFV